VEENKKDTEKTENGQNAGETRETKKRPGKKYTMKNEELLKLKEELDAKTKENAELKDKFLRLAAEFDNFKKRTAKEKQGIYTDALCDAVGKILPVNDNLERALSFADAGEGSLKEGLLMIKKQMDAALEALNVKEIEAEGKPFNPDVHNAVLHVEDEEKEESVVVEVLQKGYAVGDKVIRHSMVKVAN
jgi:molecular chaperone GrpE